MEIWQKLLSNGFFFVKDLLEFLEISKNIGNTESEKSFKTRVPIGFAQRMQKGNPNDPLLLQVLASKHELKFHKNYTYDPINEKKINVVKGLLHKYYGRVLLIVTKSCAVNCRFCFRRYFTYTNNYLNNTQLHTVLDYISNDSTITEVILSGGDPLLITNNFLDLLLYKLSNISQLQTIRIHTRIPIVLPERINDNFLQILKNYRLRKVIVFHSNHPQELNEEVLDICIKLKNIGCYLLNQSVLLKNINDQSEVLINLSHRLFSFGITPYYLHTLDKVFGSAHFNVSMKKAISIHNELQHILPGYLVPRLVTEGKNKRIVIL